MTRSRPAAAGAGVALPLAGVAFLVGGTASIAAMDAVVKHASQDYHVLQIAWLRYVVQTLTLLVVVPWSRTVRYLRTRRLGLQLTRMALILVSSVTFFIAIHHISLAQANAIAFAAPLLITALSVPILGERVGLRRWTAVVIGLAGVLVIVRPGVGELKWPLLLPLVMAFSSAIYHTTTPLLARSEDPSGTLHFVGIGGTVVFALAMPFVWVTPDLLGWIELLAVGLLGTLGHFLLIAGFARCDASAASPMLYLHLVWATLLGAVFFAEFPDAWTFIGAAVLIGAGLYVWWRERERGTRITRKTPRE